MTQYYLAAATACALSFVLTGLFANIARKRGIFMPPIRERDVHTTPIPRIGGLAVVLSFLIGISLWQIFVPDSLNFTGTLIGGVDQNLLGLILAVIVLTCVNVVDDFKGVHWSIRLTFQIIASLLVAFFGIQIQWLSNPFGDRLILGALDWLFVVIWLVGLSNVINWLDGINGLAGGVSAIALAVLFFLSVSPVVAQQENALVAAIAFGSVLGFLPHNLGKAKAFLGDTGSVFLGFLIGVVAIISGGKVATAFLALAIPFLDAIVVFFSRVLHKQSPFMADKRHLHHRFLAMGFKPWQIVALFYVVSLLFGLIALNTQTLGKFWAAMAALVLMAVFVALYSFGGRIMGTLKSNGDKK